MSHQYTSLGRVGKHKHTASTPSPLRHASTVSNSSAEENAPNPQYFTPTRTGPIPSSTSQDISPRSNSLKRSIRATSPTKEAALPDYHYLATDGSPPRLSRIERPSLQPLPQGANMMLPPSSHNIKHSQLRARYVSGDSTSSDGTHDASTTSAKPKQQYSIGISRSDSKRAPTRPRPHDSHAPPPADILDTKELEKLGKSTTGHLRTLSKLSELSAKGDFKIVSAEQEVAGLHGRRRLQNASADKSRKTTALTGYGGRIWMDQQRQFLQAYEYLCHIGEAKEWIEDIVNKPIPPIVQLEEALRDGVTLAEVVQALQPDRTFRIFQHAKLQFRHSDNIAIFFKFLSEVELPELFRFELVDLYEKKNIPKVIYCIHALSWLLFRKGLVDFRIGNLVGHLQFEDHELEEMQKGLDRAGVSMPNFSGMSEKLGAPPQPEPEPVETEDERIERELMDRQEAIADIQAQVRGALLRLQLGNTMQHFWDNEHLIVDLQSRIRGDFSRQVLGYRLQMMRFSTGLQSISRGFLVRSRDRKRERHWKDREKDVILLQSLFRARTVRQEAKILKNAVQQHHHGISDLQAAIRGALKRRDVADKYDETREMEPLVTKLQAAVRGSLERQRLRDERLMANNAASDIAKLQSLLRAWQTRRQHQEVCRKVQDHHQSWTSIATIARAHLIRRDIRRSKASMTSESCAITNLQAIIRGKQTRLEFAAQQEYLKQCGGIKDLQSVIRGSQFRRTHQRLIVDLQDRGFDGLSLQSLARGSVQRTRVFDLLCELDKHDEQTITLQATCKALILRGKIATDLEKLDEEEDSITDLQSLVRGMMVRAQVAEKQRFYQENMKKVVKIQSFVRGRQQGEAYKSLTSGKNPPVGTVKNFVHLLNDSDFDFDEEVESEKLQKTLFQRVQANEQLERDITELDAKIGLLAQTKITSDEVARIRKHYTNLSQSTFDRHGSVRDSFNSKTLNRNSRTKLERYGELFYYLQTQPQYWARYFRKSREHGNVAADTKRLEVLVMGTFAFAQKRREEYFLLKVIARSMKEEIDGCASLQEFIRGNFFFARLFAAYTRVPRDRKYVKQVFGQIFNAWFIDNRDLDLESDPLQIYRAIISDEELRYGRRSERPLEISREQAINDKEVRGMFIGHLQDLRTINQELLASLEDTLQHMPFGTRYVVQQMFDMLQKKFHREQEEQILNVVGNWLWKAYFKAAVNEPESCGVVDRPLDQKQKRNLSDVSKVIGQIALGRLFQEENMYLQPLNTFIEESMGQWQAFLGNVIQIPSAEIKFDISEFSDLYGKVKPMLYVKMPDVIAVHDMIASELSYLCISPEDNILRDVLRDLGNPRSNEAEMGAGSAEISLTLSGRAQAMQDPDAEIKALFMETKRCVLYIIRVQSGVNLMEIMVKPITPEDEVRWESLVREELANAQSTRKRNAYTDGPTAATNNLSDLASMSYAELKAIALENILALESTGRLSRHNQYQDILNEIAVDIRNKHRRRVQRQQEIERTRGNIAHLEATNEYLKDKNKTYAETYTKNLDTLQSKAFNQSKFVMPFSKQWKHLRELEKTGHGPHYGSYKRSAENFASKGILLSWEGRDLRNDDITISSDEVNKFMIEGSSGSTNIIGATDQFTWDDLLNAEFEGVEVYEFFKGNNMSSDRKGPRRGVLRVDRATFKAWMSKKFFPDA